MQQAVIEEINGRKDAPTYDCRTTIIVVTNLTHFATEISSDPSFLILIWLFYIKCPCFSSVYHFPTLIVSSVRGVAGLPARTSSLSLIARTRFYYLLTWYVLTALGLRLHCPDHRRDHLHELP